MLLPGEVTLGKSVPHDATQLASWAASKTGSPQQVVDVYPVYEEYWTQLVDAAVTSQHKRTALETATQKFPTSVVLWTRYLKFLAEENASADVIREHYQRALGLVGHHFNGDSVWDFALEYEKDNKKERLELYLRLTKIPLYQYNQYYTQWSEICKTYEIGEVVPEAELTAYATGFGHSSASTLSLVEKHQILDDWAYKVYQNTQSAVAAKWHFEEKLLQLQFVVGATIDHEPWKQYLLWSRDNEEVADTKSVYDRWVTVAATEPKPWLSYLGWLHSKGDRDSAKGVYERALAAVAWDCELAVELRVLSLEFSDDWSPLERWIRQLGEWKPFPKPVVVELSQAYATHLDSKSSEAVDNQDLPAVARAVIAVSNLQSLQDADQVRAFFNDHIGTTSELTGSIIGYAPVWRFFIEFEGMRQYHMKNLQAVVQKMIDTRAIPEGDFKVLYEVACDVLYANGAEVPVVEERFPKAARRHAAHPGVLTDHFPEITNPQAQSIRLDKPHIKVPPFPVFKNVERASQAVNYPSV
ncbi:hypothetical protein DICA3_E17722 [Diutina catenulata]